MLLVTGASCDLAPFTGLDCSFSEVVCTYFYPVGKGWITLFCDCWSKTFTQRLPNIYPLGKKDVHTRADTCGGSGAEYMNIHLLVDSGYILFHRLTINPNNFKWPAFEKRSLQGTFLFWYLYTLKKCQKPIGKTVKQTYTTLHVRPTQPNFCVGES